MIIVTVHLASALDGSITELARMHIANDGDHPNPKRGNYTVRTLRGRDTKALNKGIPQREGEVRDYPRLAVHVWNLVARSLAAMGYKE